MHVVEFHTDEQALLRVNPDFSEVACERRDKKNVSGVCLVPCGSIQDPV